MSMRKFHKAAVALAVAGALAAPAANAVQVSENGLGDFIYSPIYNVRDGFRTYINVHNTSEETLVFKIRFREHYNSREVRDFNVTMSPYDVWTAQIFLNEQTGAARLETPDHSCVSPIAIRDAALVGGVDVNDFTNYAYRDDGGPTGLERTQMGYFEIINMGQDSENDYYFPVDNDTPIAYWAEHTVQTVNGVEGRWPRNCSAIDGEQGWLATGADLDNPLVAGNNIYEVESKLGWFSYFDEPENSLKVNVAMINTETGVGFSIPVTTLANFFNPDFQDQWSTYHNIWDPGDLKPDAADVFPRISTVKSNTFLPIVSGWPAIDPLAPVGNEVDPVSAVLMRANVINQFRSDDAADSDWVVTFPTKHFYTDIPDTGLQADDDYVFPEMWEEDKYPLDPDDNTPLHDDGACVQVAYNVWDREEDTIVPDPEDLMPSPPPPDIMEEFLLCREVNIVRFGNGVLHSAAAADELMVQFDPPFDAGWVRMDIGPNDANILVTDAYDLEDAGDWAFPGTNTYEGLPIIGFDAQEADNYWSYTWEHAYGSSIVGVSGDAQWGENPAMGDDLDTDSTCVYDGCVVAP